MDMLSSYLLIVVEVAYFIGLIFYFSLGYQESQHHFSGYQVKHVIFWTYPLGRVAHKVVNIQLTKGE